MRTGLSLAALLLFAGLSVTALAPTTEAPSRQNAALPQLGEPLAFRKVEAPPGRPPAVLINGTPAAVVYQYWATTEGIEAREPQLPLDLPLAPSRSDIQIVMQTAVAASTLEIRQFGSVDAATGQPAGEPRLAQCVSAGVMREEDCSFKSDGVRTVLSLARTSDAAAVALYAAWYVPASQRTAGTKAAGQNTAAWAVRLRADNP